MGWTIVPVPQSRVYHYSENPAIARFEPHVPATNPSAAPCVWAIEAAYAPLYWFPRGCPRVTTWANDDAQRTRIQEQFGTTARRLHVIETARRPSLHTTALYEYEFDGAAFEPWGEAEGQWIAHTTVEPLAVRRLDDLERCQHEAGVELRDTDDLAHWRDKVVASGLPFSIVRFANAGKP